jgi:uncharacterized membrane protein YoaK (UPF0700 family)
MFEHRLDQTAGTRVVFHWYLLSFNGGCVNAGGFLATGRFVSHVTGFATLFGVSTVHHELDSAVGLLSVPFFFLMGSFLAGMLIDRPIHRNKKPHFDYVMGLSAFCLFLAALGGELAQFGKFGGVLELKQVYVLLALLCLACGLQNGAITSSSGSSVRTTHLTGLTTDLGLGLARLLTYSRQDKAFKDEVLANRLRSGSIASFVLGSAVGAWFFVRLGYGGFLLPAMIASYAVFHGRRANITAHRQKRSVIRNAS